MNGGLLWQTYALADLRGCSLQEVEQMSITEMNRWFAYYEMKHNGNKDRS